MSYEANAHGNQMKILRHLLLKPDAGFAELQRTMEVESDAASFHIKQLVQADYIAKNESGHYALTRLGKEYSNRMDTDERVIEKQPKLSVALIIENENGEFLAQERLKHPYYGYWGRPTGKIRWGEKIIDAAARELMEEAGLTADLEMKGIYHKIDVVKESGELLEDKYFCLIHGTNPQGTLIAEDEGHKNQWMKDGDLAKKPKVFQSVPEITKLACAEHFGYMEKAYQYNSTDY